jgi:hypothetical protein
MRSNPQDEVIASEINANHGKPQYELNANKVTAGVIRNNLNRMSKPQMAKRRSQQSKTFTILCFVLMPNKVTATKQTTKSSSKPQSRTMTQNQSKLQIDV